MCEPTPEKTTYWIKWVVGGDPEWVVMGPGGEIGGFNDRIEALTCAAEAMGLTLDFVDMGHDFNDLPDGNYWMTLTARSEPHPGPPYIPPTLDWQIKGLLQEGSPVVDTAMSAQYGYRGTVLDRTGGLRVCWTIPDHHVTGEVRWMITSITGGSGLDLSLRRGRNRAVDWLCDHICQAGGVTNWLTTSPTLVGSHNQKWILQILPCVAVEFNARVPLWDTSNVFHIPALGQIETSGRFPDGTAVSDGLAIKAIVEWVHEHPDELAAALKPWSEPPY